MFNATNQRELLERIAIALRGDSLDQDVNTLGLIKDNHLYVVLYMDSQRGHAMRQLGCYATNPELTFSWNDAAVLTQKILRDERAEMKRRFDT